MKINKTICTASSGFTLLLISATSNATNIDLSFDSLPSAQGWTYNARNYSGVTPADTSVFSFDGTKLTQNMIGQGTTFSNYEQINVIDPNLPFTILATARVLETEVISSAAPASALWISARVGGEHFGFSFNSTSFTPLTGTGDYFPFDGTQFHNYRVEAIPGVSNSIYIDDTLLYTDSPFSASSLNILHLGNASSFENGLAEITKYQFIQNVASVPTPAGIWLFGSGLVWLFGVKRKSLKSYTLSA